MGRYTTFVLVPDRSVRLPALCVACAAPLGSSTYAMTAKGESVRREGAIITSKAASLNFPLCETCGAAYELVQHTRSWRRKKLPKDQLELAEAAHDAVNLIVGAPQPAIQFWNERYAEAFERVNADAIALKKA